ncbi:MAG TPA: uracil-DNA glycosylase [Candidatus Dormibacteraeota bacterium]|nr:uracil-DNA glycosylase [Candidatus Dormibacteraeota bacterium]
MTDPREELSAIAREARAMLERERTRGRERIAFGADSTKVWDLGVSRRPPEVAARPPAAAQVVGAGAALSLPGFETVVPQPLPTFGPPPSALLATHPHLPDDLGTLARMVSECRKCGLCETRTNTVFADGSTRARLVFIGEAPGRDEDLKGLPFVGRAGQLLDKMIAAIDLKREEVYICNVLKCRPPENRVPAPQEVEQCLPYLEQQLALLRPALLCALGLSAVQALLKTKASMASLRGRTFEYRGIPLIPTYHPAALLRNPGLKREAWEDMQRVRDTLKARTAS